MSKIREKRSRALKTCLENVPGKEGNQGSQYRLAIASSLSNRNGVILLA
ncbi:hypothetical protein [Mixta hanseatica]|uniref:Uncharacterized protein n=1 Tax=Mixta hanseatica TaxID=2872648 RepID=A0ABY4R7W2_9GAMM|nr:hypothetical protein [Mixta hanseatica]UQY43925.1 hypothetical protein K6958_19140 [Mixta hanseatica]